MSIDKRDLVTLFLIKSSELLMSPSGDVESALIDIPEEGYLWKQYPEPCDAKRKQLSKLMNLRCIISSKPIPEEVKKNQIIQEPNQWFCLH
ncbi:hypothetical protein JTB14_013764 [Gonioctena quinquepunctata]|nr:hypothetical protein JTB14_013764 [Gonioctena quinquepunctata]